MIDMGTVLRYIQYTGRVIKMIDVCNIKKCYGAVKALDNVSLSLKDGERLCILGPSGSGKTTLLRLISGLEAPDLGEIFIDGRPVSTILNVVHPSLRNMGFVFQSPSLWPHMKVADNILFGLSHLSQDEKQKRLHKILEMMSLTGLENRFPSELSGGEAKRVSMARTLAAKPRYILMDEPLTNLDSKLKSSIIEAIRTILDETKASFILVTHQIDEANLLCQRLLEMKDGRLSDFEEKGLLT